MLISWKEIWALREETELIKLIELLCDFISKIINTKRDNSRDNLDYRNNKISLKDIDDENECLSLI